MSRHNLIQATFHHVLHFGIECAYSAVHIGCVWDYIVDRARVNLRDAHHQIIKRIVIATDNCLDRLRYSAGRDHRIARFMRHRAMTTDPFDINVERINRSHDLIRCSVKPARDKTGRIVNAINGTDVERVHDPFLHHDFCAAAILLSGLENQRDAPFKISRFCEVSRCAKQHHRVPVMPTSMHFTLMG